MTAGQAWLRNLVVGQSLRNASALFEVAGSTTKGSKIAPSMTTAQRDAISSPQAGLIIFNSETGKYNLYTGTAWVENLSGNKRQGIINFITNPGAEVNTTGWAVYADAAASTPADGTGGSPNSTLSRTTTSGEVLRGIASFKFSKGAADRQGEGISYDFDIDPADQGKESVVQFRYFTSANYASSDIRVFVYDKTNGTLLNVRNGDDGNLMYAGFPGSLFTGRFYPSSNSTSYRLIFHITSTNASAYDLFFDEVVSTPQSVVPGFIGTAWETFTPSGTWPGTYTGKKRRIGDSYEIEMTIALTGVPTGALQVTVPDGQQIDSNKISTTTGSIGASNFGVAYYRDTSGATANTMGYVSYNSATAVDFRAIGSTGLSPTSPFTWASGDSISAHFIIPISGWSSGALISSTEASLQTAKFFGNSAGSTQTLNDSVTSYINFESNQNDPLAMWVAASGTYSAVSGTWSVTNPGWKVPRSGWYFVRAAVNTVTAAGTDTTVEIFGTTQGVVAQDVWKPAGNGSSPVSVFHYFQKDEIIHVRMRWRNGSGSTSLSTSNARNALSIIEIPDFSRFGVYGETALVESYSSAQGPYTITAGNYGDLTSIPLTPGEWDIEAVADFFNSGAVTTSQIMIGISSSSGNSSTGLNTGVNAVYSPHSTTSGVHTPLFTTQKGVVVTSPTTYYLKSRALTSITNLQVGYKISARKVK